MRVGIQLLTPVSRCLCTPGSKKEAETFWGRVLQDPGLVGSECQVPEGLKERKPSSDVLRHNSFRRRPSPVIFNEAALSDNLSLFIFLYWGWM